MVQGLIRGQASQVPVNPVDRPKAVKALARAVIQVRGLPIRLHLRAKEELVNTPGHFKIGLYRNKLTGTYKLKCERALSNE